METQLSVSTRVEPVAHHGAQIVSLQAVAIAAGVILTAGMLLLAVPFSDQIAVSLSLLS